MSQFLMILMAAGAVCGGIDRLLGCRFHLGEKFEEGFRLLGPLALSMAGIMCLMPALSGFIETVLAPVCRPLGLDPGIFGGILAIDMGGYQLAVSLADDPAVGQFAGIIIAATFGCTIVFTIPVGMSIMPEDARDDFARGLLLGLIALPCALIPGGLLSGLPLLRILKVSLPIFILAVLLFIGMKFRPVQMIRGFSAGAHLIELLSITGLILAAVQYILDIQFIPGMLPLGEAMQVISSIAIFMLGSLPLAELIKRALHRPFLWFGRKTGMNGDGTAALLIGAISATPALGMFGRMDSRSRVVNGAALVSGASALAAHFSFTLAVNPDMVTSLLAGKAAGMFSGIILALLFTQRSPASSPDSCASAGSL